MKLKRIFTAVVLAATAVQCGCVTKQSNKGFQTSSPANVSNPKVNAFGQPSESGGIKNLFAGFTGGKDKRPVATGDQVPNRQDPISMQAPATVSAELLIVAGEMGLQRKNYDAAVGYFERALKMEPQNVRASVGLAKAEAGRGNIQRFNQIINELQARFPNQPDLLNSFSQRPTPNLKKRNTGIQLVSHVEEIESSKIGPEKISVANLDELIADTDSVDSKPVMTLSPEIEFQGAKISKRVSNPYFGTTLHSAAD